MSIQHVLCEKTPLLANSNMTNPLSAFHPRPAPRKRAKRVHEDCSYTLSDTRPENSLSLTAMAQPGATTSSTYVPHASLETVSNKIKKLQSDLGSTATGQLWGPGKQKVLDCKHDVDVLAGMVKGLEVQSVAYVCSCLLRFCSRGCNR